ncbi:putative TPX2 central domain-containing protein [Rosa chinensis]|uniref:Putative TPX2 central domain-containing protein n=1 Tax=Rosa chinensis TaxID=74649 RepID=A0A2P6RU48_ROSCH|nr:protein TPX2 [Rosa chinensis]PRQ49945.1 putative TPX2 central domain-containing protein [Rosa chinensis]
MPPATEEPNTTASSTTMMIDEIYEFSAPRFFDFIKDETDDDKINAELWFDSATAYAPSPFMPRIKTGRSFTVESMCDFTEAENMQKNLESSSADDDSTETKTESKITPELKEETIPTEAKEENSTRQANMISADKVEEKCTIDDGSVLATAVSLNKGTDMTNEKENSNSVACTPKPPMNYSKKGDLLSDSKKHQGAKKISSMVRNPSGLRGKSHLHSSQTKNVKPYTMKREENVKNTTGTPMLAQENQAIKRQKLDGGRSRQILNPKPQTLPHKSKLGYTSGMHSSSTAVKTQKEDRKMYVREPAAPFVSMAEMMNRFQSSTRDLSLPHSSLSHMKPKLTLTRPKEPEFETSQRVRSVRVKSTAELEEEMMAKIPKFKARPVNKKILEAPSLPAKPRSTPQPPEFQEFHLETMARANQNAETSSVASTDVPRQNKQSKPHHLTEPKTPTLHTLLRARPPRVKTSLEIEQEELEKIPKFKAKPLNKKIFESKGDLGMFCNAKKQVTKPQEFHFATNERIPPPPPPSAIHDLFDKLSLNSEPHQNPIPRNTMPNPFHLHTEERGAEKERKFFTEVMQKQLEEERARVPKANPYPYTTDYPVIPPKPEPKECTKPEPFQLESLARHEEEMQREMEERRRIEMEEAQMRVFKAQPILKEDPIPVPERVRKPLTEVQEFNLNVNNRAVHRAEFDHKVKEKEIIYKRYREESEAARMLEEEKALKQLRRTLVPHARPVPNFEHPFCPQKCPRETTKAKSPNLRVLQRQERRRMMIKSATSSAAAQMR